MTLTSIFCMSAACPAAKLTGCPIQNVSALTLSKCPLESSVPCASKKCHQDCAKPCCGGVALFDGKSTDGWVQRGGKAKYKVVDGMIVGTTVLKTPNSFLCTKDNYSNFILHLDFKVDDQLNSGIQIRSNSFANYKDGRVHGYQVEIDPSQKPHDGKRAGPNLMEDGSKAPKGTSRSWTGGIYDEARNGWLYGLSSKPKARAAFKPGQWNHFKIIANGNSIKTWINGVPAADLDDKTTKEGFIALQVHATGSKTPLQVRWKNIFLKEIKEGDLNFYGSELPQPKVIAPGTGCSAPGDAIVLFDGKDLSQWNGRIKKGENKGKICEPKWKIENECMIVTKSGDLETKQPFGSCQLHIEWATPNPPSKKSQSRGNSGIFFMGKYEVQVLDSYTNQTYPDGQAGGIYKQSPPLVNACRKSGEWQTYDIIFHAPEFDGQECTKPATLTVLHNGVLIQDHFTLVGPTEHKKTPKYTPHDAKLAMSLQDHGNPVRYRNIWIREL